MRVRFSSPAPGSKYLFKICGGTHFVGNTSITYDPQGSLVARIGGSHGWNGVPDDELHDQSRLYDGYGKELWTTYDKNSYFPFRYKGQAGYINDYETGLVYCWNRYYDPTIGRWITRDPIGLSGVINTYAYCEGNPIMYSDPSGLVKITAHWYSIVGPGIGLGTHFFISIEDNDPRSKTYGQTWLYSGFPVNRTTNKIGSGTNLEERLNAQLMNVNDLRSIHGRVGPYDLYSFNGRSSSYPIQGSIVLQDDLAPFSAYLNQATKAANAVNRADITYVLLADNSNAVARYLIESFGLSDIFFNKLGDWEENNRKLPLKYRRERNASPGILGWEFGQPKGGPKPFPHPSTQWWIF